MGYVRKQKVCRSCKNTYPVSYFSYGSNVCGKCEKSKQKEYNKVKKKCPQISIGDDPRKRLYTSTKMNAHLNGREHTIQYTDITLPSHCIYLGVELCYSIPSDRNGEKPFNLASLDRIDSSKGYIPGNVQVISFLANRMKQNATVEQLLAFAKGINKVHK